MGGWLTPILVFSFSLDQAEQYFNDSRETPAGDEGRHYFLTFLYFRDSLKGNSDKERFSRNLLTMKSAVIDVMYFEISCPLAKFAMRS